MDRQPKKIFSIIFAVLIGTSVIFIAWKGPSLLGAKEGIDDGLWKDSLSVVPQNDVLKTLRESQNNLQTSEATTTMDTVARNVLANYTLIQKAKAPNETLSDADISAITQVAIDKIKLPQAKKYSANDFSVSNDNSIASLEAYINKVVELVKIFNTSQTKSDIEIAFTIPKEGRETERAALIAKTISRYEKLIQGLLSIKVPSVFKESHLQFIQKYANIEATIEPMSEIFTDSLKGLAALAEYRGEVAEFDVFAKEYADYLSQKGIQK